MRCSLLPVALLCVWAAATALPAPTDELSAALADPARPAGDVALDPLRKPIEVIAFAGLKPGDRIADFMSGNGYFTRIFSRAVGATGQVYAFLPTQQLANCAPQETAGTKTLARDARYANVQVLIDAADRFVTPEPVDVVWLSQSYHDLHDAFMKPIDVDALNAAVFRALKPGGIYLIIDHVAAAGSGLRDTATLHRIDPASIRAEVTAAGFVLEAESSVLRNPEDSHALRVFDASIRHRTDQVVLKFRKPGGDESPPVSGAQRHALLPGSPPR